MKNNQKGRSMIEMLSVLAVAGVMTMSGTVLYSKALKQRKINNTVEQVSQIVSNIKNAFRNRKEITLPTCSSDPRKLIPSDMCAGGKIAYPFGEITLKSEKKDGEPKTYKKFSITFNVKDDAFKKDKEICAKLLTADYGNNISTTVNGKNVAVPLQTGTAATYCKKELTGFTLIVN